MAFWPARKQAPGPATPPSRVHAVRKLDEPPQAEEQPREWFAVELTWSPEAPDLAWSPAQLAAVEPGRSADEGTWGVVAAGRRWADDAWVPADDAIPGPQRVRLLLAVWPGGPATLELRRGEAPVAALDLGRADRAPALTPPERFEAPGECDRCQDMGLLNAFGRCQRCRQAETRPGAAPAAAPGGKQARAARPAAAAPAAGLTAGLGGQAGPKVLAALVAAFVAIQVGLWAWPSGDETPAAAPPEVAYASRLGLVRDGLAAYQRAKQALPPDAAALAAFMQAQGAAPVKLVAPADPLPPEAVVYEKTAAGHELFATTTDGQRAVLPEGKAATTGD